MLGIESIYCLFPVNSYSWLYLKEINGLSLDLLESPLTGARSFRAAVLATVESRTNSDQRTQETIGVIEDIHAKVVWEWGCTATTDKHTKGDL